MILLLLGYMWLFVHRPFEIWPWLTLFRIELVYFIGCSVFWLLMHQKNVLKNINIMAIMGIFASILISEVMTNNTGELSVTTEEWLKVLLFAFLLMTSLRDEKELKIIVVGFAVIFFIYMLHSYYEFRCGRHEYRMGIVRMVAVNETMSDPNSFGYSIVFSLPLLTPLWSLTKQKKLLIVTRLFIVAYLVLAVICIRATGSRASMIGLLSYLLIAMMVSKYRLKILVLATLFAPILWFSLDTAMQNRYLTIIDPSRGPANAQASAEGRVEGLKTGLWLLKQSPVYGFGPGQAQFYTPGKIQTHNLIGQVAGELGGLGLLAYFVLCVCIVVNFFTSRLYWKVQMARDPASDPFMLLVSQAVLIALFLLILLGMGGHNAFRYTWIWFAVFQAYAVENLKRSTSTAIIKSNNRQQSELVRRKSLPTLPKVSRTH